jgi:uncharacterized protein YjbJ (UPF0337 family)
MAWMDKLKNRTQISRGRAKQTAGKITGNGDLESEGVRDEQVGNVKQAGEKVKDAFRRH